MFHNSKLEFGETFGPSETRPLTSDYVSTVDSGIEPHYGVSDHVELSKRKRPGRAVGSALEVRGNPRVKVHYAAMGANAIDDGLSEKIRSRDEYEIWALKSDSLQDGFAVHSTMAAEWYLRPIRKTLLIMSEHAEPGAAEW